MLAPNCVCGLGHIIVPDRSIVYIVDTYRVANRFATNFRETTRGGVERSYGGLPTGGSLNSIFPSVGEVGYSSMQT
jgi:hypothetical protein